MKDKLIKAGDVIVKGIWQKWEDGGQQEAKGGG